MVKPKKKRKRPRPQHLGSAIYSSVIGSGDKVPNVSGKGDIVGMLLAVGGSSSRTASGIDTARAAKRLGVSPRTVQRWLHTAKTGQGQHPSGENAKKLVTKSRQAATTKRGRQAALARSGARTRLARGATVSMDGWQGPGSSKDPYGRDRVTSFTLDPEDVEHMLNAWEDGGQEGFLSWVSNHWSEQKDYPPNWTFGGDGEIDVRIDPHSQGGRS
jgi:transposase